MADMLQGFITKDKIFYDLGSGAGKPCTYAIVDHGFKQAIGIELSKERYDLSNIKKDLLPRNTRNKINYINNNFLDDDYNYGMMRRTFCAS